MGYDLRCDTKAFAGKRRVTIRCKTVEDGSSARDGKRTESDILAFYGEMERAFPQLLDRHRGDPYRNLYSDLKDRVEEPKKVRV